MTPPEQPPLLRSADGWAAIMSSLCLVHCLALPVAAALLPAAVDAGMAHNHVVHWALLLLTLPVSLWALRRGWQRHRDLTPTWIAVPGLLLMAAGASVHGAWEALLTVSGGVIAAWGHWRNWRLLARAHG